jgi:hypothetical protein
LYVASDAIDDTNVGPAYEEVSCIAWAARSPWLNPFRVKLVRANHPVARAVSKLYRYYPGQALIPVHRWNLDGVWVDDAIVYASPFAAKTEAQVAG